MPAVSSLAATGVPPIVEMQVILVGLAGPEPLELDPRPALVFKEPFDLGICGLLGPDGGFRLAGQPFGVACGSAVLGIGVDHRLTALPQTATGVAAVGVQESGESGRRALCRASCSRT